MFVSSHNKESSLEAFADVVTLTWNNQQLHIRFDENENGFKVQTDKDMVITLKYKNFNSVLIQDGGK